MFMLAFIFIMVFFVVVFEWEGIYTICSVYLYLYFPGDPINMGGTKESY